MTDPDVTVLQAVLDAIKGTLDPRTQIADHPNVQFAQMQRLRWAARADHAEATIARLREMIADWRQRARGDIHDVGWGDTADLLAAELEAALPDRSPRPQEEK